VYATNDNRVIAVNL